MRFVHLVLVVCVCVLAMTVNAAPAQVSMTVQMNKPEKPVLGLPYSAEIHVNSVQQVNGTTLKSELNGRVYRSADGRERYEVETTPNDPNHPISVVYLLDHAKHTTVILNTKLMTATHQNLPDTASVTIRALPLQQPRIQGQTVKVEDPITTDLGKKSEGLMTLVGRRVTGTIPAGKAGNDQPLSVTTDVWVNPQLKIVVEEIEHNPLAGERNYELSNIRGEEPDPSLFEIPQGYSVKERPLTPLMGSAPPVIAPTPKTPAEIAKQIEDAKASSSAAFKNSVAYSLAQSNDHLEDAQMLAQQAVEVMEKANAIAASRGDVSLFFQQSIELTSYWDTLGWVYYRQGKLDKAESYLRAAWEMKPNPEYGLHLGNIYEAQHRPQDAATMYRMSLSAKNSLVWQDMFQTLLGKLGYAHGDPLPMEVSTSLPMLHLAPATVGKEAVVEISVEHTDPPVVTFLQGDPAQEKLITLAIQQVMAKSLPDDGPETVLRRARVHCVAGQTSVCALDFLVTEKAKTDALTSVASKP